MPIDPEEFARAAVDMFGDEDSFSVTLAGNDRTLLVSAFARLGWTAEMDPERPFLRVARADVPARPKRPVTRA